MDLNKLSLILFGLNFVFYSLMTFAILSRPILWKFFLVFVAWVVQQCGYVWYGLYTKQIGFILIGVLEIIVVISLFVLSGRVVRDNFKS